MIYWGYTVSKTMSILDIKVNGDYWPKKSPVYVTWWFGTHSKLLGIQMGPFRVNLHYDRLDKINTFKKLWRIR